MFGKVYSVLDESLDVLSDRQNLIASNIANANTPGYKAKTVNFKDVMENIAPSGSSLPMEATSSKDLTLPTGEAETSGGENGIVKSYIRHSSDGSVPPLDGNTVDLSKEMTDMTANSIRYQAVAGLLMKKFSTLNYVIDNTNP